MEVDDFSCFPEDDEDLFNQIDEDLDLAFALSLEQEITEESSPSSKQEDFPSTSKSTSKPLSIIDSEWELIDPNPDVHALFLEFNTKFFYGKLDSVEVRWSPRMTLSAGVCCYEGKGRLCSVRLSSPLLKLRPRKDLIETLLHEMIHAYLFVTANNKDHAAHGPEFLKHMNRINKEAGTKISVYHSFHDEVDSFRTHWWKCNGPCQNKRPFYGIVKRAMNRAPGPRDDWWAQHQSTCGGTFIKIKEPDNYKQRPAKRKLQETKDQKGIKSFFEPNFSKSNTSSSFNGAKKHKEDEFNVIQSLFGKEANIVSMNSGSSFTPDLPPLREMNPPVPFAGQGFALGSSSSEPPRSFLAKLRKDGLLNSKTSSMVSSEKTLSVQSKDKNELIGKSDNDKQESSCLLSNSSNVTLSALKKSKLVQRSLDQFVSSPSRNVETSSVSVRTSVLQQNENSRVECPICSILLPSTDINNHLDQCLLATN